LNSKTLKDRIQCPKSESKIESYNWIGNKDPFFFFTLDLPIGGLLDNTNFIGLENGDRRLSCRRITSVIVSYKSRTDQVYDS